MHDLFHPVLLFFCHFVPLEFIWEYHWTSQTKGKIELQELYLVSQQHLPRAFRAWDDARQARSGKFPCIWLTLVHLFVCILVRGLFKRLIESESERCNLEALLLFFQHNLLPTWYTVFMQKSYPGFIEFLFLTVQKNPEMSSPSEANTHPNEWSYFHKNIMAPLISLDVRIRFGQPITCFGLHRDHHCWPLSFFLQLKNIGVRGCLAVEKKKKAGELVKTHTCGGLNQVLY